MRKTAEKDPEPRVLVTLFDFVEWLLRTTNRFPKNWRVTLGDRLDRQALDLLLLAQEARFAKDKCALLEALSRELDALRLLARLSVRLECIRGRQYEYAAKQIDEIGRQVGGWLKQQRGKTGEDVEEPVS
jgi:hypothetical protein